jgi:hypothetical protein
VDRIARRLLENEGFTVVRFQIRSQDTAARAIDKGRDAGVQIKREGRKIAGKKWTACRENSFFTTHFSA